MELLGERPVWSMSGSEKLAALDALEADLARRQTYRLHLIAGLDQDGHAQEIGAHDTAQLLAFRYRLDRPEARRDVRLAQNLSKYLAVSAALPATDQPIGSSDPASSPADEPTAADVVLRPAQAEAIVSALERVPDTVPVEDLDVAERELVGLARHLSPAQLRKAGQRVRDVLDTDCPEPDEHKAYARESLTLIGADRGVKFRGYLANENAELLRSLIHAGARPHRTVTGDLDPRPRDKRQADALSTALTIAAAACDANPTAAKTTAAARAAGATPPDATTARTPGAGTARAGTADAGTADAGTADAGTADAGTADAGTADAGTADAGTADAGTADAGTADAGTAGTAGTAGADGATGAGRAGWVPGFGAKANITVTIDLQDLKSAAADAIGDVVYGNGLSAATIRRLACDAKIIPLVLGAKSEPLDVGRAERLVTGAMRRALNARDKGCVVCGAPPVQCEAHHLQSWIDGGATAVHNLALLCKRHHIDLHAGEWIITITGGMVHVDRPAWADPPPQHTRRQTRRPDTSRPRHQAQPEAGTAPSSMPSHELGAAPASLSGPEPGTASSPMPGRERATAAQPLSGPERGTASPCLSDLEHGTASLGESGVPTPLTAVAALNSVSSMSRRTAIGAEVLQQLLAAKGESAGPIEASSLREAASLAIWGEPATPTAQPLAKENHTSDRDQPLAPDDDQPSESPHGLHDDQRADRPCAALTTAGSAQ